MKLDALDPFKAIPSGKKALDDEVLTEIIMANERDRQKPLFFELSGNRGVCWGDWKIFW